MMMINRISSRLGQVACVLMVALVAMLAVTREAFADKIYLKDGRVLEGEVVREVGDVVFFQVQVGTAKSDMSFMRSEIDRIEKIDKPAEQVKQEEMRKQARELPEGATRIAFLSMGDQKLGSMVGTYMAAGITRDCVKMLKALPENERPEVLVLEIDSGGGSLAEVEPLSDLIHKELKKDFRVVAWIESAISAAAMTAVNCEEMIMKKQGHIGGAVAYMGGGISAQGAQLQQILKLGQMLAERGKYNADMIIAMQMPWDLSVDIDEDANSVIWYNNLSGETVLNYGNLAHHQNILTLNSEEAKKFKVSIGTADTKDDVAELLGYTEWVEVGQEAEARMQEHLENTQEAEARLGELVRKYQNAVSIASQMGDMKERGRWVGQASRHLDELASVLKKAPNLGEYQGLDDKWFRDQRELLRKLMDRRN